MIQTFVGFRAQCTVTFTKTLPDGKTIKKDEEIYREGKTAAEAECRLNERVVAYKRNPECKVSKIKKAKPVKYEY